MRRFSESPDNQEVQFKTRLVMICAVMVDKEKIKDEFLKEYVGSFAKEYAIGYVIGYAEAFIKAQEQVVVRMLKNKKSIEEIANVTDICLKRIEELNRTLKDA